MERVMRQLPPAKGWLPRYGLGPATDAITLPQVEVLGSTKAFYRALDIAVQQARYEVCLTNFSLTGLHWESFEAPRQGDATLPKPSELLSAPEADSVESYARSIAKAIDNRAKEDDRGLDIRRMVTILSRSKYEHVWSECCKYEDRARFQCRVLDVSSLYEENDLKMLARLAHNFRGDVPAPKVPYPMNLQLIDHEIAIITRPALGYQTLKEEGTSLLFRGQDVVRPLKDFYNRLWEQLPALKDGRKVHVNMFSALADGLGMEKSLGALTNELEARRGAAALCD